MQADFIKTVKENKGIIYKVTKIYTDTREDQQDLYQEILYQLWKSFPSFSGRSKISTWIYRVTLNTSLSFLSKQKKNTQHTNIQEVIHFAESTDSFLMDERMAQLYQMIKKLNEGERGIILLYLEGKKYEEIADITGFSATNIGTKLNRIKQKLKNQIIK